MDSGGEETARWKGRHVRKELRRPLDTTTKLGETEQSTEANPDMKPDVHTESGDSTGQNEDDPSSSGPSTLSPFAKEFIPRKSVLSPYAKEFTPSGLPNEYSAADNEEVDDTHEYYITMVQHLIDGVTISPASFEREIRNLTSTLNDSTISHQVVKSVAEIIVNQGIQEPNFRYNAVRMCRHLSDELCHVNFRNMVLKASQATFDRTEDLLSTPDGHPTYRGYALFLGEIFSQIQIQGKRLEFLGERIPKILENLLQVPTSDNLKCVCQVIKFVGAHLEDQERASNENRQAPIMDRMIQQIGEYAITIGDTLDRCIKGMLLAVVELRTANYGRRNHSPPVSITTESFPTNNVTTDPILYGPDGQQLTSEEALFMESLCKDVPNGDPNSDPNSDQNSEPNGYEYGYEDNYENEQMDDEMCTAFEEFLRDMPH